MNSAAIYRSCFTVVSIVVSAVLFATPATADPHHPASGETLLRSCVRDLRLGTVALDVVLPPRRSGVALVPSFNIPEESDCNNFGWAQFEAPTDRWFTVAPFFAGPNIASSEWDCNHSSIHYGIYRQVGGQWGFIRGGLMYGRLVNGRCGYDVNNFPTQADWARNSWRVPPGGTYRIATRSWSHDDPGLGHQHNLCAHPMECVWSTFLSITLD